MPAKWDCTVMYNSKGTLKQLCKCIIINVNIKRPRFGATRNKTIRFADAQEYGLKQEQNKICKRLQKETKCPKY